MPANFLHMFQIKYQGTPRGSTFTISMSLACQILAEIATTLVYCHYSLTKVTFRKDFAHRIRHGNCAMGPYRERYKTGQASLRMWDSCLTLELKCSFIRGFMILYAIMWVEICGQGMQRGITPASLIVLHIKNGWSWIKLQGKCGQIYLLFIHSYQHLIKFLYF